MTQAVYTTMPEVFCMLAAVILFLCMDQQKACPALRMAYIHTECMK